MLVTFPLVNQITSLTQIDCTKILQLQKKQEDFYRITSKISLVAFPIFSLIASIATAILHPAYLPAIIYPLLLLYQPYINLTYHSCNALAEKAAERVRVIQDILSMQSSYIEEIKKQYFLPDREDLSLAYFALLQKEIKSQQEKLKTMKKTVETREETTTLFPFLETKYKMHQELLCKKILLSFLLFTLKHTQHKRKLSDFGEFNKVDFLSFLCFKETKRPLPIFTWKNKTFIYSSFVQKKSIEEISKLFLAQ